MSNPFLPGGEGDGPDDQLANLLRQLGITVGPHGEIDFAALVQQMQSRLASMGGGETGASGVNWDRTRQFARQVTATLGPDPTPTSTDQRRVADAGRLADLWLDKACALPELAARPVAWSRAEWIENTMGAWQHITDPIAASMAQAMGGLLQTGGAALPPELAGISSMLSPMLNQMAGSMYSMQLAQALGQLSTQVLTGTEIGLQLLAQPRVVVLPAAVGGFGEGLDIPADDVLLYLTLRETARQRLFAEAGWLAPQLLAMVEHYAREIRIDTSALEDAVDIDDLGELTPDKLLQVSENLKGRLFEPTRTAEQDAILARLETLVALIEGWVDEVTSQAAQGWMPAEPQLSEMIRRRRGAGGPAETVFRTLVGLELRPRRVRDAATLWAMLREARGIDGRDALWAHPDLAPGAEALDDPQGFVHGTSGEGSRAFDEIDLELQQLLNGGPGNAGGPDAPGSDGPAAGDPGDGPEGPDAAPES